MVIIHMTSMAEKNSNNNNNFSYFTKWLLFERIYKKYNFWY